MPQSLFGLLGNLETRADRLYRRGHLTRAAKLFRKAGRYGQSASIYIEEGKIDAAVEVYREAGQPRQAGEVLMRHGRPRDAVALFEEAAAFRQAAEACVKLKQPLRAGGFFERAGLFQAAGEAYTQADEFELALRAWERESERLREEATGLAVPPAVRLREIDRHRAELLVRLGRERDAAELMIDRDRPEHAARLLERLGRYGEAARAYLEAGEPQRAAEVIDREDSQEAIDDELRLEVYTRAGRDVDAAKLLERLGRLADAAGAYEDALEWGKAASLWERAELPDRAADLYLRVERFAQAGQCFAASNQHERAGQAFARAGNDRAAADAYLAAERLVQAAEHYLKAGARKAARSALQGVRADDSDYDRASFLLIPLLLGEGLAEGARRRLEVLESGPRNRLSPATRYYWHGRIAEAEGELDEAERNYQLVVSERSGFRDSGQRLSAVRERLIATGTNPLRSSSAQPSASGAMPGPQPATGALATPPGRDTSPLAERGVEDAGRALDGLPFVVEAELEPWWPGVSLFRARARRGGEALLLTFPLEAGSAHQRFRNLAGQARQLTYPSILKLEEAILADDRAVLRFEPTGAQPMSRRLDGPWRPLPSAALNILVQVGEGLAAAHQLGLVHGWLSPNTILIDDEERIKLVGFGLDTLFPADDGTAVAYRAPEVVAGVVAGPAADLFSFGLLGVELLGALLPVDWARQGVDLAAVTWSPDVAEVVPETVRTALVRCLSSDPLMRPSSERLRVVLSSLGLMPGQRLQGRYEIEGEIGRGGMSRVYQAYDRTMAETVAIKTLLSPMLRLPEEEQRLLREVQICRRISHPNVVRVHDLGQFPGGIFITMELLDGERLDQVIRTRAPMPLGEAQVLLRQIAAALGEAHRMDVVHRDLKPGNVIVAGDRVKVLDFGIARMGGGGTSLTRTGEVYGSPLYMAPEQIRGKPLEGTCDLYALGVISFALLTGREPFLGDSPEAVIYQHLNDPPPDPHTLRPTLPVPWVSMLEKLLAKKPSDRFANVDALIAVLDALPTAEDGPVAEDTPAQDGDAVLGEEE